MSCKVLSYKRNKLAYNREIERDRNKDKFHYLEKLISNIKQLKLNKDEGQKYLTRNCLNRVPIIPMKKLPKTYFL